MPKIRVVCAGLVAAMAIALALGGARAQTAPSEPVGKPLALLAGLRPPHEGKAHEAKARLHAKTAHRSGQRTAAAKKHGKFAKRVATVHSGHAALKEHEHRERSFAAAAPAEAPPEAFQPAQATPSAPPTNERPTAEPPVAAAATTVPAEVAVTPAPVITATNDNPTASVEAVSGRTAQADTPDQVNSLNLAASQAAAPNGQANAPAASQTVLAAPMHRDTSRVGSASWIAQVLAAVGGAVTAGAVAWFLIGGGPVRTYG
jgi:hypothetical protein